MENKKELTIQMFMEEKEFMVYNRYSIGGLMFGENSKPEHLKMINTVFENVEKYKCKLEIINSTTGEKIYKTVKSITPFGGVVKNGKILCPTYYFVKFEIEEVENGKEL